MTNEQPVSTRRPPTIVLALAVPVIALIALVATRAIEGPSDSAAAPRAGANAIVIKNFAFKPQNLTVAKGTRVEVTNADGTVHTLSATNGSFDTGDLAGGATKPVVLNRAGRFDYFCKIHNYMTGTLVVR